MKILVSGCSFSTGHGLASSLDDPRIWPNLLGKKLNADVINVAVPGYDNPGIFLNAVQELTTNAYDLILIQATALGRLVVSPNMHSRILLTAPLNADLWKGRISKGDYENFQRTLIMINQYSEHWHRLKNIIFTVQNLVAKGYNIKFVNGLLEWDRDFFDHDRSEFLDLILDVDDLPDEDIQLGTEIINRDKKQINLDLWVNPFESLRSLQIDHASETDRHPGIKSQALFSEFIFNHLQ